MQIYVNLYLLEFSLEWDMFQKKSYREAQNTHFMSSRFFLNMCHLWDSVEKYGRARQDTDGSKYGAEKMWFTCEITKARLQTHTCNIESFLPFVGNSGYAYIAHLVVLPEFLFSMWKRKITYQNWKCTVTGWESVLIL